MSLTLSHWGAASPVIKDGRLISMDPNPGDPNPSPINENYVEAISSPMRITQPMVRKGYLEGDGGKGRGEDSFVPVSWETATTLLADHMKRILAEHGNEAIFGGSYGWASAGRFHHAQSQIHRFLNLMGGYVRSVNTHSHAAAEVVLPHMIGSQDGLADNQTSWELIIGHTELFVAFGGLPVKNAAVSAGGVSKHLVTDKLREAKATGTHIVNVGPLRDDVDAELGAEWIAPRPNTDVAFMLGLAYVLETEGLVDRPFLDKFTVGYEMFRPYLLGTDDGQPKDPAWAAAITGVDADIITGLARRMAAKRTLISMAWSLQRADHGEQAVWMVITLAAMLGQIGLPGGGFGTGYAAANRVGNTSLPFSWPAFPQLRNPIRRFIPVARLGDMLEFPGEEFDYNGERYTYPDIKMIWWAGGNPFHHQQDLRRLHRVWKNPELVVVQEPLWNAIARHADIALPATMPLERNDLGITKGEPHLIAMKQVLPPPDKALSDYDILALIADKFGIRQEFTEGRDELAWIRELYARSIEVAGKNGYNLPDFDSFWETGDFYFQSHEPPKALLQNFRQDPAANPLATPSGLIEIGSAKVASFGYDDCPGYARWFEPSEWLGAAHPDGLHLISNQPSRKLHSQLDVGGYSRAGKVADREPARLNSREAERRGISSGDVIRVRSPRGECLAGAVVSEDVADGVIQISTGAWLDLDEDGLDRHGNVNVLTMDTPTSRLAQGPTAHTTIVFVERYEGKAPDVLAFEPPLFEKQE
ncbi:Asp-tRNA(Asn)/Glu-tRNA(Gln) amidotransferase GatCAB subunit C [Ochrobactrum sp. XJ1]|nr:Asp-tRNA(Asn)/Glu-tRNA(Gln) amidotransferase GatCAB subunit C [Ochrobactrum sp. XJ1]